LKSLSNTSRAGAKLAILGLLSAACPGDSGSDDATSMTVSTTTPTTGADTGASDGGMTSTSGASGDDTGGDTMPATTEPDPDVVCDTPATETHEGDVYITPETMDAIDTLANVRRINGKLEIYDTNLTHLDFLICLEEVAKDISLYNNDQLLSVKGLNGITLIGDAPPSQQDADPALDPWGNIVISDHDALTDFDGFKNLEEVPVSLLISRNEGIAEVSGFTGLVVIYEAITIRDNTNLADITGLDGVQAIGGVLSITANPNLCLSHINDIFGDLQQGPAEGSTTMGNNSGC